MSARPMVCPSLLKGETIKFLKGLCSRGEGKLIGEKGRTKSRSLDHGTAEGNRLGGWPKVASSMEIGTGE